MRGEDNEMNVELLAQHIGLKSKDVIQLLSIFVDTSRNDIQAMHKAMADGNTDSISESAHSLKGSASAFGFQEIVHLAHSIEIKAKENALEDMPLKVKKLQELVDKVTNIIENDSSTRKGKESP